MDAPEIVTMIKDVVLAVAAGVTAWVAVSGIRRWRKELEGRAGFDAARALARATFRLRDALRSCRSPLMTGDEYPDGYFDSRNKSDAEKAQGLAHVYNNRFLPVRDAINEFDTQALEAEALWGSSIRQRTDALRHCVVELRVAIEATIENAAGGGRDFESDRSFAKEMRSATSDGRKDNKLTKSIDAAVGAIEDELRKHLGRA